MDVFKKGMISWITTTCICIVSNRDVDAVRYRYASIPYSADYCTYSDLVPSLYQHARNTQHDDQETMYNHDID
jgi:hypothetical protein